MQIFLHPNQTLPFLILMLMLFQADLSPETCLWMSSFPRESRDFHWHLALPNLSLTLLPPCSLSLSPTDGHSFPCVLVWGKFREQFLFWDGQLLLYLGLNQGRLAARVTSRASLPFGRTGCYPCHCGHPQLPKWPRTTDCTSINIRQIAWVTTVLWHSKKSSRLLFLFSCLLPFYPNSCTEK